MAKVRRQEVSEQDLFGDVRKSTTATIEEIRTLNKEANESARILEKELNGAIVKNTASLEKFIKTVQQANKLKREAEQLDKREAIAIEQKHKAALNEERLKQQKLKTEREQIRNGQIIEKQKVAEAKAADRAAKAALDENNAYKKLVVKTREAKNESKRLAAEMIHLAESGKRNTKEYREVASTYRQVTKEAQAGDKVLKKIDATVGDNFRNVGNYSSALDGVGKSLRRVAGYLGLFQAVKGVTAIVANFDQAQADLLAISGKTAEQMADLTKQAKDLGATTQFSATEITNMQIELAKLGFSTKQIEQSTKAVSSFAAATGAEIPDAAALAGASLRGFGLDASEMGRVVSVLGVATTKTALDFNALQTGMSTIAPVANAFGFSIEDTTALLGQLANAGFDASSAATATRNILLNLADSNGKLAQQLGRPIKSADDLAAGLQELQAKGIDLATALELTDKRSVAAFETFLKGSDSLVDLRDSITGVEDELDTMAEKRLDSISGQFTLLASAWEGWVLSVNEGSGIGETVKNLIGGLARNLDTILGVMGKVVEFFLIFKARMLLIKAAASPVGKAIGDFGKSLLNIRKNGSGVISSLKGIGSAMKGIGFSVAITLVVELVKALWDFASGAAGARRQQELFEAAIEDGNKTLEKYRDTLNTTYQDTINKINLQRSLNQISEKEAAQQRKQAIADQKEIIKGKIQDLRASYQKLEAIKQEQIAQKQKFADEAAWYEYLYGPAFNPLVKQEAEAEAIRQTAAKQKELRTIIEGLNEDMKNLDQSTVDATIEINNMNTAQAKEAKEAKKVNTEFRTQIDLVKELNAQYERYLQAFKSIEEADRSAQIAAINEQIDAEKRLQLVRAKREGEADPAKAIDLINERKDVEIKAIEEARDFEIQALRRTNEERFAEMRKSLDQEREELIKGAKGNAAALAEIEKNYQAELAKIKTLEVDAEQVVQTEIIQVRTNANNEIIDKERETAKEIEDVRKEMSEANQAYTDKELEEAEKAREEMIQAEKDAAKRRQDIAKLVSDYLIAQSDRRIEALDKEIEAHKNQVDALKQLAAEGNINAQQSIAEENRLAAEAEKAKLEEEKRKQRIELAATAFSTYQSHVEAGSEQPLADTIRDISLLQAFINALPAFESGTENTGSRGEGIDGRGGFLSVLHPYERVMDADNNAKVGNLSNDELARIAHDYNTGRLTQAGEAAIQIGGPWQSAEVGGQVAPHRLLLP